MAQEPRCPSQEADERPRAIYRSSNHTAYRSGAGTLLIGNRWASASHGLPAAFNSHEIDPKQKATATSSEADMPPRTGGPASAGPRRTSA